MPTAELAGVSLHHEERGHGPALLLIAGIPAIASDWEPLASRLAESGHRMIAYDNRGSGSSSVTPGPYSTVQLAADALALLDHLAIERADVFGRSMGGMIAQELALLAPKRIRRLVLGCTHSGGAHVVPAAKAAARAFALKTEDWTFRMRALAPHVFAEDVDHPLLEAYIEKKSRDVQDPAGYAAQIDAVRAHDATERLGAIEVPTLVLTGDQDRIVPAENSRLLAGRIPAAQLRVIAGTGHLFFLERPDATVEILEGFLASPTAVSRPMQVR